MIVVYGSPKLAKRKDLRLYFNVIAESINVPLVIEEDWNMVLSLDECNGVIASNRKICQSFKECILNNNL